jgi:hypothetical protein
MGDTEMDGMLGQIPVGAADSTTVIGVKASCLVPRRELIAL